MSIFLLFKGDAVNHLYNFIINFDIKKLFLNLNEIDYYKKYLLDNFNIFKLRDMTYNEYFYTYIVNKFEMGISKHMIDNNIDIIPYISREQLISKYNFYGIPIFENPNLFLKILPVTKKKVVQQYNLYDNIKKKQKMTKIDNICI